MVHGDAPDTLDLQLLGTFQLREGGRPVRLPTSGQRLLACLAVQGPVSRSQAAGSLWPDAGRGRAGSNLRTVLWRLRAHSLRLVHADGDSLWLDDSVRVDYGHLRRWTTETLQSAAPADPSGLPARWMSVLLPDWNDEWLDHPRDISRINCIQAVEMLGCWLLDAGQPAAALSYLIPVTCLEPLRESSQRLVISAHLRQDNVTEALAAYDHFRARIRVELGLEPSAALTALVDGLGARSVVTVGRWPQTGARPRCSSRWPSSTPHSG